MAKRNLTQGDVKTHLKNLVLPTSLGLFASITFSIVDTAYIGQLGANELAAMGFCFPVIFFVTGIGLGLGVGVSAILSRLIGQGAAEAAQRFTSHILLFGAIISGLVTALGLLIIDPLFSLLSATEDVLVHIRTYMRIWFFGVIALVGVMICSAIFRANGNAKFPGNAMIGSAIANAAISPVLIFGLLGFPKMEIAGAAIGTLIARSSVLLLSLYIINKRFGLISWRFVKANRFWGDISRTLNIGGPAFLSQSVTPLSVALITFFLAMQGTDAVAAYAVGSRIENLAMVPLLSLQIALIPFVGQNLGAKQIERIRSAWSLSLKGNAYWAVLVIVIAFLLGTYLTLIFTDSKIISDNAAIYLRYATIGFIGFGLMATAIGTLNAIGHPYLATCLSAIRLIALVPLCLGLGALFGLQGIFASVMITYMIVGLISLFVTRAKLVALKA